MGSDPTSPGLFRAFARERQLRLKHLASHAESLVEKDEQMLRIAATPQEEALASALLVTDRATLAQVEATLRALGDYFGE